MRPWRWRLQPAVRIGAVQVKSPAQFRLAADLVVTAHFRVEPSPRPLPGGPAPGRGQRQEERLRSGLDRNQVSRNLHGRLRVGIAIQGGVHPRQERRPDDQVILEHDDSAVTIHDLRHAGDDRVGESAILVVCDDLHVARRFPADHAAHRRRPRRPRASAAIAEDVQRRPIGKVRGGEGFQGLAACVRGACRRTGPPGRECAGARLQRARLTGGRRRPCFGTGTWATVPSRPLPLIVLHHSSSTSAL